MKDYAKFFVTSSLLLWILTVSIAGAYANPDNSITGDIIDCTDNNYVFCDGFDDASFNNTKWHQQGIACTQGGGLISCPQTNSGSDAGSLYWMPTYKTWSNSDSFCVEWSMNTTTTSSSSEAFGIGLAGWSGGGGNPGKIADTFAANEFDTRINAGSNTKLNDQFPKALYKYQVCHNSSNFNMSWFSYNGSTDSQIANQSRINSPSFETGSGWWVLNYQNTYANYYYVTAWNGSKSDAPYLVVPPVVIPISNSSWNITTDNVITGALAWNNGSYVNITSDLLAFTVSASENTNMSCSIGNDLNYTSMVALSPDYKAATTDTTSHAYVVADDIPLGDSCLFCSFIRSDGTGELENSTSGCLQIVRSDIPASIQATIFPSINFSFASTSFVTAQFETFNTTRQQNVTILSAMNIEKVSLPVLTRTITGRIIIDGNIVRDENLRTVTNPGATGSAGFSPTLINIPGGKHNITIQFRSTGVGSINIDNLDTMLLFSLDAKDNDTVNMYVENFKGSHLSPGTTNITAWNSPKYTFSKSFIIQRILATKAISGATNITYYNKAFNGIDTSPFFERSISANTIGSMEVSWMDSAHIANHTYDIFGKADSSTIVNISINGSAFVMDDRDSNNHLINSIYLQDPSTNDTAIRTITSSSNLVNGSMIMQEGDSIFMSFSVSLVSNTGSQEVTITIGDNNSCKNQKQRTFSSSGEVGNIFLYALCSGYSHGENVTLFADIELSGGETVDIQDESLIAGEAMLADIASIPSPPVPNQITNPDAFSTVAGIDTIDWFFFSDPDDDITGYEVRLQEYSINESLNDTVGIWRFEEGGGSVAIDSSPNGINGIIDGATSVPSRGNNTGQYALDFDGVNDQVIIPDNDLLTFSVNNATDTPFTIGMWVNMTDATFFRVMSKRQSNTVIEWSFFTAGDDTLRISIADGDNNNRRGRNTAAVTAYEGKRTHFAATYSGNGLSSGLKIYINGVASDITDDNGGTYVAMHNTIANVTIGNLQGSFADGLMDEIFITDTQLSQPQIQEIIDNGLIQFSGIEYSIANTSSTTNSAFINYSDFTLGQSYFINVTGKDATGLQGSSYAPITIGSPIIDILLISPQNNSVIMNNNISFLYNISRDSECNLYINNTLNATQQALSNITNYVSTKITTNSTYLWNVSCSDTSDFSGSSSTYVFRTSLTDENLGLINFIFAKCPDTSLELALFIFIAVVALILLGIGYYFNLGLMTFSGALILFMQSISIMFCHFLIGGVFFGGTLVCMIWGSYLMMTGRF